MDEARAAADAVRESIKAERERQAVEELICGHCIVRQ